MAGEQGEYQVRSVDRAISILELLMAAPDRSLTQLAQSLQIPKSTCFNIVSTLLQRGLLVQDPVSGRFRLGPKTIQLGSAYLSQHSVRQVARPHLEEMVAQTREEGILGVLQEPELAVIYVDKVDSPQALVLNSQVGRQAPAHATALGKALLAWLPAPRLEAYLSRAVLRPFTSNTITDAQALRRHLAEVRAQGYAFNYCELDYEGWGVAAPVFDHTGSAVAAISVAGPIHRLSPERKQTIADLVMHRAAAISRALGAAER